MKQSKACIFCNTPLVGKEKSEEHIFPKWLQKYLGVKKTHLYQTLFEQENEEFWKTRQYIFNNHVSGLVCEGCNTGWMSNLEDQVKSIIIPLIDGQHGNIEQEQCKIVAKWLYKTALTLHSASIQQKKVPAEHYKHLYEKNEIPKGVVIAIAPIHKIEKNDHYWIQSRTWPGIAKSVPKTTIKEYLQNAYKISMRAGNFSWRVTYLPRENTPNIYFFDLHNNYIKYVHPCKGQKIIWNSNMALKTLGELDSSLIYMQKIDSHISFS